ncbi:hypothetical protein GGF42_002234 [Coemansia sp. RSA 2424]|nr:hypothetical protein GGF42_002234 [Coemansia sp. RSA 2424]
MTKFIFNGNNVPDTLECTEVPLVGMTGAYAVSQARELLADYLELSDILQLYMFDEFGDHPEWLKQVDSEDMVNIKFYLAYIDSKSIAKTEY